MPGFFYILELLGVKQNVASFRIDYNYDEQLQTCEHTSC